jgi:hypothetical protein
VKTDKRVDDPPLCLLEERHLVSSVCFWFDITAKVHLPRVCSPVYLWRFETSLSFPNNSEDRGWKEFLHQIVNCHLDFFRSLSGHSKKANGNPQNTDAG